MSDESDDTGAPDNVDDASTQPGGTSDASALKGMLSFFTLIHLDITERDMESMDSRFHLVPIIGSLFGLFTWIVVTLVMFLDQGFGMGTSIMAGVFCLAVAYIGSKFLHFDGLTDFGDGMIVSGPPEKHVHALKDSLVGAGGIGVALTVILLSVCIYASMPLEVMVMVVPMTEVFLKFAMVVAAAFGIPGHGMAGRQVEMTTKSSIFEALLISIVLCVVLFLLGMLTFEMLDIYMLPGWGDLAFMLLVGFIMSTVVGVIMAHIANKNFGMVNGDILGATNEVTRPVVMFALALLLMISWW